MSKKIGKNEQEICNNQSKTKEVIAESPKLLKSILNKSQENINNSANLFRQHENEAPEKISLVILAKDILKSTVNFQRNKTASPRRNRFLKQTTNFKEDNLKKASQNLFKRKTIRSCENSMLYPYEMKNNFQDPVNWPDILRKELVKCSKNNFYLNSFFYKI